MNEKLDSIIKNRPVADFDIQKAAQVAAFFAKKEGGRISVFKLVKLIYLSDREYRLRYDFPILNDVLVLTEYGTANSYTLDFINGNFEDNRWSSLISEKSDNHIGLVNSNVTIADLNLLGKIESEIFEWVWERFDSRLD